MKRTLILTLTVACGAPEGAVLPSSDAAAADASAADATAPASTLSDATSADAIAAPDALASLDSGSTSTPDASASDAIARPDAGADDRDVRVLRPSCEGPLGNLPGTTCQTLELRCGGLDPIEVALRVTEPAAGVARRGVVVFGSGGAGTGLWSGPASTRRMMSRMLRDGFTLVERQWLNGRDAGWFEDLGGRGLPGVACRYSTLLRYVDETIRRGDEPLCATGNSGGSAELVTALAFGDAADRLDLAIPSSGPFHRADLACGATDASWERACADLVSRHCPGCAARGCALGNGPKSLIDVAYGAQTPCTGRTTPLDVARLAADSPIAGRASFGDTKVVLLIGEQDEGPYAPLSAALFEALSARGDDVRFETEPATGHEFQSTDEGAERIEAILRADCAR